MPADRLRSFVSLAIICVATWAVSAQAPHKVLEPKELREDLALLRSAYENAHGGLYRHSTKAQMDAAFDRAAAVLDHPMTDLELFRVLAPVVDQIHDAHTSLRANRDTLLQILRETNVFPFDVRYVDGRAFATTLIIDIRGNGGGYDELNTELLRYLVPHPFRFYRRFTFRQTSGATCKAFATRRATSSTCPTSSAPRKPSCPRS